MVRIAEVAKMHTIEKVHNNIPYKRIAHSQLHTISTRFRSDGKKNYEFVNTHYVFLINSAREEKT